MRLESGTPLGRHERPPPASSPAGPERLGVPAVTRSACASLARWLRTGEPPEPPSPEAALTLVEAAHAQRVAPLLYLAVRAEPWPAEARARLRERHQASFVAGARLLALAGRLLSALEAVGVRALPMKGVALVERTYSSVADRPMADVDLLVLGDWGRAVEASRREGLHETARSDHAWVFRDPHGSTVELHHSVTSCPGLFPVDADGLWSRSVEGRGTLTRRPGPEDLLVHLALHAAFQHALILTLGQYHDFKRLLASESLDGAVLEAAVERSGAGLAVAASLVVADALVGLPADPALAAWSGARLPGRLARWLDRRLCDPFSFLAPQPAPLLRLRWELAAGRRVHFVARTLAPRAPGEPSPLASRARRALTRAFRLARRWR